MIEEYIPKFLQCLYSDSCKDADIQAQELIDMFHENQIVSKKQMIYALDHLDLSRELYINGLYIGSWMGFMTRILSERYNFYMSELELDERCGPVSRKYNEKNERYREHIIGDALYQNKSFYERYNLIVNTSCEHMESEWYYKLPNNSYVFLQCNDYDTIPDHINCVYSIEEMKGKYPMHVKYESETQCTIYKRYTLAGQIKF